MQIGAIWASVKSLVGMKDMSEEEIDAMWDR